MRLIDRDEMLSPKIWDMNIPNDIPKEVHDSLFELYNRLIHIPTVDAEPIRHGHWEKSKDDNDRWRCSHCGYTYIGFNGADTTFAEMCNYCPHCGAKMDEVEEDE